MNPHLNRKYAEKCPFMEASEILQDAVAHIGWTEEEFVDASAEYYPENLDFDWNAMLIDMWVNTYSRIHSFLDIKHKFEYYNDWKDIIVYGLAMFKHKLALLGLIRPVNVITPADIAADVRKKNRFVLPTDLRERRIIGALLRMILMLNEFLLCDPEEAYKQLSEMRERVLSEEYRTEAKREANRLRKMKKRHQKKRK